MSAHGIKALTFDTGGTILDWHSGIRDALAALGKAHGVEGDWSAVANEFRRRSLKSMLNHGEHAPASMNFDDVHRQTMDSIAADYGLNALNPEERRRVWWDTIHSLTCWPDFPAVLPRLRERFVCASFTILSFRIIIDTAKRNGLSWDAVISCEAIGQYKVLPAAYQTCARWLQLDPSECCMVACHNFDLDAARSCGFKTAFVRRPREWGNDAPPDPDPNPQHDFIVDDFPQLAEVLGVAR